MKLFPGNLQMAMKICHYWAIACIIFYLGTAQAFLIEKKHSKYFSTTIKHHNEKKAQKNTFVCVKTLAGRTTLANFNISLEALSMRHADKMWLLNALSRVNKSLNTHEVKAIMNEMVIGCQDRAEWTVLANR